MASNENIFDITEMYIEDHDITTHLLEQLK